MAPVQANASFPVKLQALFKPARYKVLYGGRSAGRSWGIARALLILGVKKPLRVLCAREFQISISESVHRVLCDQIENLGLSSSYSVEQSKIYGPFFEVPGPNGQTMQVRTEFSFAGIKNNTAKIKSYEGVDVCWVEEAENVSNASWDILIPTIRRPGSELWISFNPKLETDATYVRMVKTKPSNDALIVFMTYADNPWLPDTMEQERLKHKERDYNTYLNIWEGLPIQVLEGAVYAKELQKADLEKRTATPVPYSRLVPVSTFWDLGKRDHTAIWFAQLVNFEYRLIDYYSATGEDVDHFAQVVQKKPYFYDMHWLPHDAKAKRLGAKNTVEEQLRKKLGSVRLVPSGKIFNGIAAARQILPQCWFDPEKCADGLQALRHYSYDVVDGQFSLNPKHDWASHGADAFRYMAVALKDPKPKAGNKLGTTVKKVLGLSSPQGAGQNWMR